MKKFVVALAVIVPLLSLIVAADDVFTISDQRSSEGYFVEVRHAMLNMDYAAMLDEFGGSDTFNFNNGKALDEDTDDSIWLETDMKVYGKTPLFIWHNAFARQEGATPTSLSEYEKIRLHQVTYYSVEEINYESDWLYGDILFLLSDPLNEELEGGTWEIFLAGCVLRQDAERFNQDARQNWFKTIAEDVSNEKWLCGFYRPVIYVSGDSGTVDDLPGGFE